MLDTFISYVWSYASLETKQIRNKNFNCNSLPILECINEINQKISGIGELEMDSRPFPAPLPHVNPVPFPPPPESRLRANLYC